MQQVLNSKERSQAFWKFFLFFLLTVLLVVTAVYFDFKLPFKQNRVLQDEVDLQRQQDRDEAKFVVKMQETIVLLDSLDKTGTSADQINLQLSGKLNEMVVLEQKDDL